MTLKSDQRTIQQTTTDSNRAISSLQEQEELLKLIQPSWAANAKSLFFLLLPKTWITIYKRISEPNKFSNSPSSIPSIKTWILHIYIPLFILTLTAPSTSIIDSSSALWKQRLYHSFKITAFSPLAISTTVQTMAPKVQRLLFMKNAREEPDIDAQLSLATDIQCKQSIRCADFDVFFPPTTNKTIDEKGVECTQESKELSMMNALLLIPGAFVDHTSYATIASRIATEGNMIVVVMSLEPMRLGSNEFGANLKNVVKIMDKVTKLRKQIRNRTGTEQEEEILNWSIGGHSYGAYAALRIAPQLVQYLQTRTRTNSKQLDSNNLKVIAWGIGGYLMDSNLVDLSKATNIKTLIIHGSNDIIASIDNKKDKDDPKAKSTMEKLVSKLPPKPYSNIVRIDGGNHNNFASYTPKDAMAASFCGVAGIPRERQHDLISKATVQFLQ